MLMLWRSTKRDTVQALADELRRSNMEDEQQIEELVSYCLLANKRDLQRFTSLDPALRPNPGIAIEIHERNLLNALGKESRTIQPVYNLIVE